MTQPLKLPISNVYKDVRYIPAKKELRYITLITKYDSVDTYHLEEYLKHNDDTDVYIITDSRKWEVPGVWNNYGWKNNDVLLREWWSKNCEKIACSKLLYLEHDVLITTKITDEMFTDGVRTSTMFYINGVDVPPEETWANVPWWWSSDGDKLPLRLKQTPASTMPTILFFHTSVLDLLILPEWDDVYSEDIISEIRLPTLFNYYKIPMYNWDPNIGYMRNTCLPIDIQTEDPIILKKIKNLEPGFYHPIKAPLDVFFKDYKFES
jgi:hypothetical protein